MRFDYGAPLVGPLVFEYNEQDQIIKYYFVYGDDTAREFAYDSLGRLKLSIERFYIGGINNRIITYKQDTILIDLTANYEDEIVGYQQTVLCNLVRAYRLPTEAYPQGFDYTYTYTHTPNKLRNQKK